KKKKRRGKQKPPVQRSWAKLRIGPAPAPRLYERALALADKGELSEARRLYRQLERSLSSGKEKALVLNDLAALSAQTGDLASALQGFQTALQLDPACLTARANIELLETPQHGTSSAPSPAPPRPAAAARPIKVAILSFLFNWPSTGGGIVH